ncbi:MAG: hypothetical protein PHW77_02925 [Eubacteriales bacterium]|nr:hypothetical protein [Eubacteriales bacterium]
MGKKGTIDVEELCINCEHSTFIENTEICICKKKGAVKADGSCGKFKADLLKINPAAPLVLDDKNFPEKR